LNAHTCDKERTVIHVHCADCGAVCVQSPFRYFDYKSHCPKCDPPK